MPTQIADGTSSYHALPLNSLLTEEGITSVLGAFPARERGPWGLCLRGLVEGGWFLLSAYFLTTVFLPFLMNGEVPLMVSVGEVCLALMASLLVGFTLSIGITYSLSTVRRQVRAFRWSRVSLRRADLILVPYDLGAIVLTIDLLLLGGLVLTLSGFVIATAARGLWPEPAAALAATIWGVVGSLGAILLRVLLGQLASALVVLAGYAALWTSNSSLLASAIDRRFPEPATASQGLWFIPIEQRCSETRDGV